MAKLIKFMCPGCGAALTECGNGMYRCNGCGDYWKEEQAQNFYLFYRDFERQLENLSTALDNREKEKVSNLKRKLWREVNKEYVSNIEVEKICNDLLNYVYDDFYANFYLATCDENSVVEFISGINLNDVSDDDLDLMARYLINALKRQWFNPVDMIISSIRDAATQSARLDEFESKKKKVDNCVFESAHHRDVFVCYAHEDLATVYRIVAALEKEKLECFVAACNLQHGSGAKDKYAEEIHKAIDNCDMILFFSSANSRVLGRDTYRLEIDYIQKHRASMPRLEYIITPYERTNTVTDGDFKRFFNGHERCFTNNDSEVVRRVLDTLKTNHASVNTQHPNVRQQPRTEADFNGKIMCANAKCGAMCRTNSKFCPKCGGNKFFGSYEEYSKSLLKYCDNCGSENEAESNFCVNCGGTKFITYTEQKAKERADLYKRLKRAAILIGREEFEDAKKRLDKIEQDAASFGGCDIVEVYHYKLLIEYAVKNDEDLIKKLVEKQVDVTKNKNYILAMDLAEESFNEAELKALISIKVKVNNGIAEAKAKAERKRKAAEEAKKSILNIGNYRDIGGGYIAFGAYPQSKKSDNVTIGKLFDTERGYYLGSDNNLYAEWNGEYYKVEPIKWKVLKSGSELFIVSDLILDQHRFDGSNNNNYANSEIRSWLNGEFYKKVFTESQKNLILTTKVDNSVSSTGYSTNQYVCDNTNDKIFLLSRKEAEQYYRSSSARQKKGTDYAKARGLWVNSDNGNSYWWLRSPYYNYSNYAQDVSFDGDICYWFSVDYSDIGVVCALKFKP